MKIAVPVAQGVLCLHFGHCQSFALVEVDEESRTIVSQETLPPPPHEPGVLPRWLHEKGADLVIAGGMGMRAQQIFQQQGVKVIVGAPSAAPGDVVQAYLEGRLETGDNLCDH